MKYEYKTICIDFDGVIAELTHELDEYGPIIPGSREAILEFKNLGYKIIIHTARPTNNGHKKRLEEYLNKVGIYFDWINENPDHSLDSPKPLADLYIDDRALRFNGSWSETLNKAQSLLGCKVRKHDLDYGQLLRKIKVRKSEVYAFHHFLKNETCWATSPASTRFHLPYKGGLIEHSVNVANTILKLRTTLAPELSEESCTIVALFHDIGKVGMPGKPYYLPQPNEWMKRNRGINYIVNEELVHMDMMTRSLFLISQHIPLTDEEAQAIRYHDGQYVDENKSVSHKECKLTRLLQYADNWSGGVLEE